MKRRPCLPGAWAPPIVAADCPVPADSRDERRGLGTLGTTRGIPPHEVRDAAFDLVDPASGTPLGPRIPDSVVAAERDGTKPFFPVELMGFRRPDRPGGKEDTHPRVATPGPFRAWQPRSAAGPAACPREGAGRRRQSAGYHGSAGEGEEGKRGFTHPAPSRTRDFIAAVSVVATVRMPGRDRPRVTLQRFPRRARPRSANRRLSVTLPRECRFLPRGFRSLRR